MKQNKEQKQEQESGRIRLWQAIAKGGVELGVLGQLVLQPLLRVHVQQQAQRIARQIQSRQIQRFGVLCVRERIG